MEADFPVFAIANDQHPSSLLYVASNEAELNTFIRLHGTTEPAPANEVAVAARFYDSAGRRWILETDEANTNAWSPNGEVIPRHVLRYVVTGGYLATERVRLDELTFPELTRLLAVSYNEGGDNYGSARHRRWHRSRGIPLNRSHR